LRPEWPAGSIWTNQANGPSSGQRTRAALIQHHQVELGVIGLPNIVGTRCFSTHDQFEIIPVLIRACVRQCEQAPVQAGNDPSHHG